MENFEYYNPVRVVFGADTIKEIGNHAKNYGKKAMLVSYTDVSFMLPVIDSIHASLKVSGVDFVDYFGATANPTLEQARKGVAICKEQNIELVIGVGGGSVMDCAKMIAAGVSYQHDLSKMIAFSHSDSSQIPPESALPMILIPTLPATGSEMNPTAVVTDEKTVRKSYVWAPSCLYARVAIMDPMLTLSLPKFQTACGGIDTIAHIVESYFNGTASDLDVQDRMQEGVIKAVIDNLPEVIQNPTDVQKRGVMLWAASIALNGWLLSGTYSWAPMHQMSHVIGAKYNATHGAVLGTMILAWLKFFSKRADNSRYAQFAARIFNTDTEQAVFAFEALLKSIELPTSIQAFGVTQDDITLLAEEVRAVSFNQAGVLGSAPAVTLDEVKQIYQISMEFSS